MKVYAIIFDCHGCEKDIVGIFSTYEQAVQYVIKEFNNCQYTNDIREYLRDRDYSFIEWEINTNKKRKVKIRL